MSVIRYDKSSSNGDIRDSSISDIWILIERELSKETPLGDTFELQVMDILAGESDEPWTENMDSSYRWLIKEILIVKHLYGQIDHHVSAVSRDKFERVSRDALNMSKSVAALGIHETMAAESNRLKRLAHWASLNAKRCDPSLHRRLENPAHYSLASKLVFGVNAGKLQNIQLRKNKNSKLARLFRACCSVSDLHTPVAGHNYLSAVIEHEKSESKSKPKSADNEEEIARLTSIVFNGECNLESEIALLEISQIVSSE